MSKGRLEAFSDGIIAIIITITILLIDLPDGNEWEDLLDIMPLIGSYLISFILVGINWVNHHHLFQVARTVSGRILWSNLLYLFVLSFIPVSTGWVGKSRFAIVPVRVYVVLHLAVFCSYYLLEKAVIRSSDCNDIRSAVNESMKEFFTIGVQFLALLTTLLPHFHYLACPLLIVAFLPWIVPDLRMKWVFDERKRNESARLQQDNSSHS